MTEKPMVSEVFDIPFKFTCTSDSLPQLPKFVFSIADKSHVFHAP